jgi:hypothetical protein
MSNKNILKTEDILTAIDVCSNILIDTLKDVEYLEVKKAEGDLTDSEYQDLHYARGYSDAIRTTIKYLETIK